MFDVLSFIAITSKTALCDFLNRYMLVFYIIMFNLVIDVLGKSIIRQVTSAVGLFKSRQQPNFADLKRMTAKPVFGFILSLCTTSCHWMTTLCHIHQWRISGFKVLDSIDRFLLAHYLVITDDPAVYNEQKHQLKPCLLLSRLILLWPQTDSSFVDPASNRKRIDINAYQIVS